MKNYKVILIIISILLCGTVYIGISYSLWTKTFESENPNTLISGCFTVSFEEKTKSISLKNSYPVTDASALKNVNPYQIKISNTCETTDMGFSMTFNTIEGTKAKLNDQFVKIAVGENSVKPTRGVILSNHEKNLELNNIETNGKVLESYIVHQGYIEAKKSKTFEVYLWIDESGTNEIMNQELIGSVNVLSYSSEIPISERIKQLVVTSGEGVYKVKHDDATITSPLNNIQKENLMKTEYRYAGSNPNNYISFNNELWRIIGLVNTPEGSRAKLIRNESIGNYSWDSSETSINSGLGINEWSQADIMKLLNPGFENETVGGSLYWNSQNGNCYNEENNISVSCDFTTVGLKENAKSKIDEITWNLGTNGSTNYVTITPITFYNSERSNNNGKICNEGIECNDNIERTTFWKGFVGLIYSSDYGYATSGGTINNRNFCLTSTLRQWNTYNDCFSNNWLYSPELFQRYMTPLSYQSRANYTFHLNKTGYVSATTAVHSADIIRPSIYLKESVKIISGDGTESNPYILK